MTPQRRLTLRRKRLWNVGEFAEWMGLSHWQAREFLKRLHEESGCMLLVPSTGANRGYRFFPAVLAKVKPEIFEQVEALEQRVDELEEGLGELRADQRRITSQVGQNSRDIARMRSKRSAA